jgi:hypothetical protein
MRGVIKRWVQNRLSRFSWAPEWLYADHCEVVRAAMHCFGTGEDLILDVTAPLRVAHRTAKPEDALESLCVPLAPPGRWELLVEAKIGGKPARMRFRDGGGACAIPRWWRRPAESMLLGAFAMHIDIRLPLRKSVGALEEVRAHLGPLEDGGACCKALQPKTSHVLHRLMVHKGGDLILIDRCGYHYTFRGKERLRWPAPSKMAPPSIQEYPSGTFEHWDEEEEEE